MANIRLIKEIRENAGELEEVSLAKVYVSGELRTYYKDTLVGRIYSRVQHDCCSLLLGLSFIFDQVLCDICAELA